MERSEADLSKAMKAIQYEFNRMFGNLLFLSNQVTAAVGSGPNAASPIPTEVLADFCIVLRDASLESFLIHVRNLIDFFIKPAKPKPDDILASDFFEDPDTWWRGLQRGKLHKIRERIGKKLAHLSYRRLEDEGGWNPAELVSEVIRLSDRFNALKPAYLINVEIKSLDEEPTRLLG